LKENNAIAKEEAIAFIRKELLSYCLMKSLGSCLANFLQLAHQHPSVVKNFASIVNAKGHMLNHK